MIKFVDDVPAPNRGRGPKPQFFTDEVLAQLEANPGRWALIGVAYPNVVTKARQRHPQLEVVSRKRDGEKKRDIYARWISAN